MFKNVASQKLTVFAYDATTNLPKTGDAANLTAYVDKDDGGVTVLADTSATEKDATNAKGYYIFDLAQAETNADKLLFTCKSSTANIVVIAVPAVVYTLPTTGILAPTTAGRTLDVSAGGEAGIDWANVGSPTTTVGLSGTTIASTQKVDVETIKTQTVTCAAGVTVSPFVGSTGAAVNGTNVNTLSSHDPGETIMGATDTVTLANGAHGGTSATLRLGGSTSTPALYVTNSGGDATKFEATGADGHGFSMAGNGLGNAARMVGGASGSALTIVGGGTAGNGIQISTTDGDGIIVTAGGTTQHGIFATGGPSGDGMRLTAGTGGKALTAATIVGDITGSLSGNVGGIAGTTTTLDALQTALSSTHGSGSWATATGFSTLDASGVRSAVGLASANLDTQLGDIPTNSELATALITGLTTALTEGYRSTGATGSVRDLLYEIIAHLGESAINSTTKTLKKLDGSTTAKTYTLDSATAPTSITETT